MEEQKLLTRDGLADELAGLPIFSSRLTQAEASACVNHIINRLTDAMRNGQNVRFRGSFSIRVKTRMVPVALAEHRTKEQRVIRVSLAEI